MSQQKLSSVETSHLRNALGKLNTPEKDAMVKAAIASQQVQKFLPYYSAVRFQFQQTGTGPWVYTLPAGNVVKAFTYGQGDAAAFQSLAGFPSAFGSATWAETNLLPGASLGGKSVSVRGISLYLGESSDAELTKLVWENVYADISTDGVNRYELLGRLGRIPGGGGLEGAAARSYVAPPIPGQAFAAVGNMTNGQPHASNSMRLPSPISWNPSGSKDSNFQVRFQNDRAVVYTTPAAVANTLEPATTTFAGAAAWTAPVGTARGTYVDVIVYLQAVELIDRSDNS